jgi:hypothetical protein
MKENLNTPRHKSMIVSATLGDSWIGKNGGKSETYVLGFQHSGAQREYLNHKHERFSLMFSRVTKIYDVGKNGYKANRFYVHLGDLHQYWRHQFYPNRNKTVSRHLLNMLDAEGLATWYMDDGSATHHIQGGKAEVLLHTESFNLKENEIIRSYLLKAWGIETGLRTRNKDGETYYYLSILAPNKSKFIEIIRPHICDSMKYKIDIESRRSKKLLDLEQVV